MKTFLLSTLILLVFALGNTEAQNRPGGGNRNGRQNPGNNNGNNANTPDESDSNRGWWQASFANGGHYMVRLDHIATASKQIYISDGIARVVEVNIGADNAVVVRFYYLEPIGKDSTVSAAQTLVDRAEDLAKQAAAKGSPSAAQIQVVKNYPTSTHAHTVEFALQDEASLDSLYTSLLSAINSGRGRTWNEAGSSTPSGAPTGN